MDTSTKKVKGYAVVNFNGDLEEGTMLEENSDCACQAFSYNAKAIFKLKKDAESYKCGNQLVVPVTITFSLPKKK